MDIIFEGGNNSEDILEQFITSDYFKDGTLDIIRFLDSDNTIDIEKLELAIILIIEHLENSVKNGNRIYVNIGNMREYITIRELTDIDRIIEESSFILGFCQAVATENELDNQIIVRFNGEFNE